MIIESISVVENDAVISAERDILMPALIVVVENTPDKVAANGDFTPTSMLVVAKTPLKLAERGLSVVAEIEEVLNDGDILADKVTSSPAACIVIIDAL